jgi:hypothetical protein
MNIGGEKIMMCYECEMNGSDCPIKHNRKDVKALCL